ncbi:uncharacterized protein FFB14_12106 [Fusarium fujikuroi]|nr:uncharacterized protein FFB14_12106 [Fusarium fujikuroi]
MAPLNVKSPSPQASRNQAFLRLQDRIWSAAVDKDDGKLKEIFEEALQMKPNSEAHPTASDQPTYDDDIEANDPCESKALEWKSSIQKTVRAALQRKPTQRNEGLEKTHDWVELIANTCRQLTEDQADRAGLENAAGHWASILFIAICRGHDVNAKYLLEALNVKIYLQRRFTWAKETVLYRAVVKKDLDIVSLILKHNCMAPLEYIDIGNIYGHTPLYQITEEAGDYGFADVDGIMRKILEKLLLYRADVDAAGDKGWTPLHNLILGELNEASRVYIKRLLEAKAEVNTKDIYGDSPLHDACSKRDELIITMLLDWGAEVDCLNNEHQTPGQLFKGLGSSKPLNGDQTKFFNRELSFLQKQIRRPRKPNDLPIAPTNYTKITREDCEHFPVYFRHQWEGCTPEFGKNGWLSWSPTSIKVSHVLYRIPEDTNLLTEAGAAEAQAGRNTPEDYGRDDGELLDMDPKSSFLSDCELRVKESFRNLLKDTTHEMRQTEQETGNEVKSNSDERVQGRQLTAALKGRSWKWINFPANNMTWIQDFIIANIRTSDLTSVDPHAWQFFESNIRVRETNDNNARVRKPHAYIKDKPDPKEGGQQQSLVTQPLTKDSRSEGAKNLGDQKPATSGKSGEQLPDPKEVPSWVDAECFIKSSSMISLVLPFLDFENEMEEEKDEFLKQERVIRHRYSPFTGMHGVQMSQTLDDTASGSGQNKGGNRDLRATEEQVIYRWSEKQLETETKNDKQEATDKDFGLKGLKRLYYWLPKRFQTRGETVDEKVDTQNEAINRNPARIEGGVDERANGKKTNQAKNKAIKQNFRKSWLMVRQLWLWKLNDDIFEEEISIEMDKEARYYKDFESTVQDLGLVNETISKAARSTWQLRDIRDELRLLQRLFETQLEVVRKVAEILWPTKLPSNPTLNKEDRKTLRANFIRDLGLESLIQRVTRLNQDAYTTLGGVSTIIQAMQAQASLKEAESARFMNYIILPFTVVTVIFTPLSFLTSLFAVNSDGFPHNDDGELRIPADWLGWNLIMGELLALIPVFLLAWVIYHRLYKGRWGSVKDLLKSRLLHKSRPTSP